MKLIDLKDELELTTAQAQGKEAIPDHLYLSGTQITSLPDNLTVGDSLYLSGTQITSLPDNLTVGGYLDLSGTQIKNKAVAKEKVRPTQPNFEKQWKLSVELKLSWQNGKYRVFDGIFCEVIRQLKNAFKVKVGSKIQYVVTDGENFSHGDTIKQAKADLIYKISNRDTSAYKDLTLDSVVTKAQAIQMYRVITGACEAGTKHFVSGLAKTKAKYKIAELIKLTKGQYGAQTFAKFFGVSAND